MTGHISNEGGRGTSEDAKTGHLLCSVSELGAGDTQGGRQLTGGTAKPTPVAPFIGGGGA
jgi:hypothetical protein